MNILYEKGAGLDDSEIIRYIGLSKMLSRRVEDYENKKVLALVGINRMGEFLGKEMVKGKGITCTFLISKKPIGAPLNQRVIPVSIFNVDERTKKRFLKKWLKESDNVNVDMKAIIDWDYYIERLSNTV